MKIKDVFGYSFSAVKLRKFRAALTTLGVAIGITAIVALLSISQGLQYTITTQLEEGLAADTLIVMPGSGGFNDFGASGSGFRLYLNYTQDIKELSPDIVTACGYIQQSGYADIGEAIIPIRGGIIGVDFAEYSNIFSTTFVADKGNIPLEPHESDIVIGKRITDPRLNGSSFVNVNDEIKLIWTNTTRLPFVNHTYQTNVAAILPDIGSFGLAGPTDTGVYIPLSTAQELFGVDEATAIIVKLTDSRQETINNVSNIITEYFGNQVSVISATAILSVISTVFSTLTFFLGGIAGISLLVAGIGIMNIMVVSLIERTREIGILKAIGTKSRTVLAIFLCESLFIGILGAIIGTIGGWGIANAASIIFSGDFAITPLLTPNIILLAFGFGVGVSVIFALYPAWRASKLKPVEALRYE